MTTRQRMNTAAEYKADGAVRDTVEYMAKSLGVFLLSFLSLVLTGLAWTSVGLSLATGKLAEGSFAGAKKLRVATGKIKWHERGE